MLDLQYPVSGPYAWDIPHEKTGSNDEIRGMKATLSMFASYFGGNLSQDRIAYYVYHEAQHYKSPEEDLGDGSGILTGLNVVDLLFWELSGARVARLGGKPDFSEIKNWIDSNIPIIRDGGGDSHFITVIDGYDTDGEMAYLIDPVTGNESRVPYDSLDTFVMWIVSGDHVTAKSDEPTIWMDSDRDGVVDFDETNRFHTDPYNHDTHGLGIDDKTVIKYIYKDHLTFPTVTFTHSPEAPLIDEQVIFNASQSRGNITSYTWKFGDGNVTTVTNPIIEHAYNQQGTYNVTLTVNDDNGLWNITTSSVTALANPTHDENVSGTAFYRQSLDRTAYAQTDGPVTPDVLWTINLNDSVTTSPAVADARVFVGTSGGAFLALNLTTGEIIWTFNAGSPISSSPAFHNGVVFFGTENPGKIYAVDARTGLARWLYQVPTGAAVYSSPAVVDDKVIVGSSDGRLICLDRWEGQVLWTAALGGGFLSSAAVQNGTVFVASTLGVHAIDLQAGTSIWQFATSDRVTSCPAVADGLVFVGTDNDDHVYALNQSTGHLVWSLWTSGWLTPPAVDSSRQLVILGCKDFRVYCLEERTGFLVWTYFTAPNFPSAPTISANGLAYVGTSDGNLICLNETTGEAAWKYNVNASIVAAPSISDRHVFAGTLEGKIYCFGPPFPVNNSTAADIAVSDMTVSKSEVAQGQSLRMNTTAENHGDSTETFALTIYANDTAIATRLTTVMNGSSTTVTVIWDTTDFATGNYTLSVYAHPVPGETNTANNNLTSPVTVMVMMPGDILPPFGAVDMKDIAYVAKRFSTDPSKPLWDPNADINGDGKIDMKDIATVAKNFGKHNF